MPPSLFLKFYLPLLKGPAASCWIALALRREPLTTNQLYLATACNYAEIHQAMDLLEQLGLVENTGRARWVIKSLTDLPAQIPDALAFEN